MVRALRQRLENKYYLPLPVWLNTPASRFWSPKNICLMFMQAARRSAQGFKHGKPEILLDCSGYQYGDPWAAMGRILSLRLLMYQHFRARGGRIVMMPQALGPFTRRVVASTAAGVFQLADLVFAWDEVSRQHALDVGCPPSRIEIAPDYSNIVEPWIPDHPEEWSRRVCVVPSTRMLDKTSHGVSAAYMESLRKCIGSILDCGLEPFILVHQLEDRALAEILRKSIKGGILVVDPSPVEAKGIIASCRVLIGSRYHALVSALSQGTPAIGTGWTHKYRALFKDYGCEECLVEDVESKGAFEERLSLITDDAARDRIVDTLRTGSDRHRARTLEMFSKLERVLDEQ